MINQFIVIASSTSSCIEERSGETASSYILWVILKTLIMLYRKRLYFRVGKYKRNSLCEKKYSFEKNYMRNDPSHRLRSVAIN